MDYRKTSELKNWEKNPRSIKKGDFERLKKQIEKLGQYKPLLITPDNVVLGGNMRLRAYKELDIEKVWVSVVDPQNEAQMVEYALSDNDRAGYYDNEALAELISEHGMELDLDQFHVDMGVTMSLRDILNSVGPEIVEDEPPEVTKDDPVSKLGEMYQLGRHRLLCGDATKIEDVRRLMGNKRGDMVFTDPPYNVDYTGGMGGDGNKHARQGILNDKMSTEDFYNFLYAVCSNLIAVVDGAFYVCMSSSELHNLWRAFTEAGGHWQTYIIWAKDSFTLSRSDYQHQFEPVMYGLTDGAVQDALSQLDEDKLPIMYGWTKHYWYGGRKQGDVWRFDRPKVSKEHPTMKPVALCAKAIHNSCPDKGVVVDVFGGSGTTLIAAEQLDRTCYMAELDPQYVDVIRKRYATFMGLEDWQKATPIIPA